MSYRPGKCSNCEEEPRQLRGGLCLNCYMYQRRTGKPRPLEIIQRAMTRRLTGTTIGRPFPLLPTVYIFKDKEGSVLYVGVTGRGQKRLRQHGAEKAWWEDVVSADILHLKTIEEAYQLEAEFVGSLKPPHNDPRCVKRQEAIGVVP